MPPVLSPGNVELIVFDFDGFLTDNRVLVFTDGAEAVMCSGDDGLCFEMLRAARIPTLILSTERNAVVSARAEKLKVPVIQDARDKGAALSLYCVERGIDLSRVMFVGNDVNDISALKMSGLPVCPSDAHPQVRSMCRFRLNAARG